MRPKRATESEIFESAVRIVESVLRLDVLKSHKRDIIDGMLWSITQARGKYTTRFRSVGACDAGKGVKLQHDHVIPRNELIADILREPGSARELLGSAIGCAVTAEEHRRLNEVTRKQPYLKSWDRYQAAGITVRDMAPHAT
jgi:hypothetical protein